MRRIKRDVAERGRDVMNVLEQYQRFVKPAFDQFVAPSRRCVCVWVCTWVCMFVLAWDDEVASCLCLWPIKQCVAQHVAIPFRGANMNF